MKFLLGLVIVSSLFAADPAKPEVKIESKAILWRRIAEFNTAKDTFAKAQANLQEAYATVQKDCGKATIGQDASGEVTCIVKVEEKKAETK